MAGVRARRFDQVVQRFLRLPRARIAHGGGGGHLGGCWAMVGDHHPCLGPGEQLPFNLAPRLPSKQNHRSERWKRVASASNRLREFVLRTASHNARGPRQQGAIDQGPSLCVSVAGSDEGRAAPPTPLPCTACEL